MQLRQIIEDDPMEYRYKLDIVLHAIKEGDSPFWGHVERFTLGRRGQDTPKGHHSKPSLSRTGTFNQSTTLSHRVKHNQLT